MYPAPMVPLTRQTIALCQTQLNLRYNALLEVDGAQNEVLRSAIRFWQREAGADPTGRVDDAVRGLLPGLDVDPYGDPSWDRYHAHLFGDHAAKPRSMPIRGTRGSFIPRGICVHHTAGARDTPPEFLKAGRPDVSGPLYCFSANRTGTIDAISNGRTHNAGRGDSRVFSAMIDGRAFPKPEADNLQGNDLFYGVVLEHSGKASEPVVDAARERMVELCAMWCNAWGWSPESRIVGHREWTKRKADPIFGTDEFRASTTAALASLRDRLSRGHGLVHPPPVDGAG